MTANITNTQVWPRLCAHYQAIKSHHLREWFSEDPCRFENFHEKMGGLLFDFSKNRLDKETLTLFLQAAEELELVQKVDDLFSGRMMNSTENRPALHMALRHPLGEPFPRVGLDLMSDVESVLVRAMQFAETVRRGEWLGFTGRPITQVVNIGIGGSDLGPMMVAAALRPFSHPAISTHFVSNLDSGDLKRVIDICNPAETLFVVASKTFSTLETLTNASSARDWLVSQLGNEQAVSRHFVAVSTNSDRVSAFGIDTQNMFQFWDWVGGRYSIWSAIGLPIMMSVGAENYRQFLDGAHEVDLHFRTAPLRHNIPFLMGMLGVWYRNFFGAETHGILSYDVGLRYFPTYLQQLEMESNGKHVRHDGSEVGIPCSPVIWGGLGNNAQHAFYQMLHQGGTLAPSDFLVPVCLQYSLPGHAIAVASNALAQMEVLMSGRTLKEVMTDTNITERNAAHRVLAGNQPTNCLLYPSLTPAILGMLIALYEHKVFVQSILWGNNAFDQWGVELGKVLASQIAVELVEGSTGTHDSSTNALIRKLAGKSIDA